MATSVVSDAPVMLLDEPTTGLTLAESQWLLSQLHTFRDQTRVVVLHEFSDFVLTVCDRLIFTVGGRVVFNGHPSDLMRFVHSVRRDNSNDSSRIARRRSVLNLRWMHLSSFLISHLLGTESVAGCRQKWVTSWLVFSLPGRPGLWWFPQRPCTREADRALYRDS